MLSGGPLRLGRLSHKKGVSIQHAAFIEHEKGDFHIQNPGDPDYVYPVLVYSVGTLIVSSDLWIRHWGQRLSIYSETVVQESHTTGVRGLVGESCRPLAMASPVRPIYTQIILAEPTMEARVSSCDWQFN
jgi:hypothetical protein